MILNNGWLMSLIVVRSIIRNKIEVNNRKFL